MRLQRTWQAIYVVSLVFNGACQWAQATATTRAEAANISSWSPDAFPQSIAHCDAVNRVTGEQKTIQIHYVDVNPQAEQTIIMVHGWPSLWHSWKYQIEAFKDDYHLVVPDLRGFGRSTHPGDVQSSGNMPDMVGDLVCALEHAGVSKALCLGHDWGTQVCYEAARMRPDIFEAVIGTCIPYLPYSGPYTPIDGLLTALPKLSYNVYFERSTEQAIEELNTDIRRTLRATLRSAASPPPDVFLQQTNSFLRGWDGVPTPPITFFTPGEEDYWVEQYEIQGFNFTLNFYTYGNQYASRETAHAQGNFSIPQPTLSILAGNDPVANWTLAAILMRTEDFVAQLTTKSVDAAHWLQLEKPDEVNTIMKEWLDQWYPPISNTRNSPKHSSDTLSEHSRDEL